MRADLDESILVLVDIQPPFMKVIHEAERVVERSSFLVQAAGVLGVPSLGTTQYAARMGELDPKLAGFVTGQVFDKMHFSAFKAGRFAEVLEETCRRQVVLCGAETHICITQTAIDLLEAGYDVMVPMDAVSSRTPDSCKIGFKRLRDLGVELVHSESLVYEWLDTAEHPRFKEVLGLVKAFPIP